MNTWESSRGRINNKIIIVEGALINNKILVVIIKY